MRSPDRNTILLGSAIGVAMAMAGFGWFSEKVSDNPKKELDLEPNETPQTEAVEIPDEFLKEQTEIKELSNPLTGATFSVVPDPDGQDRLCLEIKRFTEENPQTVIGAITAAGKGEYSWVPGSDVYDPEGEKIGTTTNESLPDESLSNVLSGTKVCINN